MFHCSNDFWKLKDLVISQKLNRDPGYDILEVNFRGTRTCFESSDHAAHRWFSNPDGSEIINEFYCEGVRP